MKSYSDRTQAKKGSQNGKNLPIKQDFVKSWHNGQNLSKMSKNSDKFSKTTQNWKQPL